MGSSWSMDHMMNGWGMGWFGAFLMILFWIFVILVGIYLVKFLIQSAGNSNSRDLDRYHSDQASDQAIDILKECYARGEIDREEFEDKKRDLLKK